MSISERQESLITSAYSLARRSGFLDTAPGQWLFQRAYFAYKRHLEDPYQALLRRFPDLLRSGNILDVGANIGYTSLLFSQAIDAPFKVYAFEPDEFNFRLLQRAAQSRTARQRIQPSQCAVGDRDGSVELWVNPRHHGDHRIRTDSLTVTGPAVQVSIISLDSFVAGQQLPFPVRFIKVDVQGYELAVCRGMERTLAENPGALIALEYMPSAIRDLGFEPLDLLHWIGAQQFIVYVVERGAVLRETPPDRIVTERYVDLLLTRKPLVP